MEGFRPKRIVQSPYEKHFNVRWQHREKWSVVRTAIYTSHQQFYLNYVPWVSSQFSHVLQNLVVVFYFWEKQQTGKETR